MFFTEICEIVMETIKYENLRVGNIVEVVSEFGITNRVVVLKVTKKDIAKGTNAAKEGLYGFRGLWYNGHHTTIKPYGKIYDLSCYDNIKLVRKSLFRLSRKELEQIIN